MAPAQPEDRRPSVALAVVAVSLATLAGCASTPAQKAEADIASVRKEADAKTLVERGKAFAAVGDHTRAEEYLASSIEAGADPREVMPILLDVCVKTGRYRSAIQHGENHLRKHPSDAGTRVMVGALYVAISDGKEARAQLERVVETANERPSAHPKHILAQAHYLLALVARDGDHDVVTTDRHFREYLRLEPNGPHAEEAKGSLLTRVPAQPSTEGGSQP